MRLSFDFVTKDGTETAEVEIDNVVVAGWTGRDQDAVEKHIAELEAIGVKRPRTTPIFYRVSADRLSQEETVQVVGEDSSGEAEFFLISVGGGPHEGLWIGLGSDHTDRKVETYNVTISKQACAKPVGKTLWRFEEVKGHLDDVRLTSHVLEGKDKTAYQKGTLKAMLPPEDLMKRYTGEKSLPGGTLMFCGTLAVEGDVRGGDGFAMELEDPKLNRRMTHQYRLETLPNEG